MTMSQKRKKNTLSLETKVKILKKLDEGVQAKRLASDFNVSTSAISYIKSKKEIILDAASNTYHEAKCKSLHKAEYPEMEARLYDWFLSKREKKCTLTGPILKAKAKKIFGEIYRDRDENDFHASDGWFTKFKNRRGIRYLKIGGELLSSDVGEVTPFLHRFRSKIKEMGLTDKQIYNVDETGLFYRSLPDKTYVAACEKKLQGIKY